MWRQFSRFFRGKSDLEMLVQPVVQQAARLAVSGDGTDVSILSFL
jgi:hypothetical protein